MIDIKEVIDGWPNPQDHPLVELLVQTGFNVTKEAMERLRVLLRDLDPPTRKGELT